MKTKKKIGLWHYIKKHIFGFISYIVIDLIAAACTVLSVLSLANSVICVSEEVKDYRKAIILLIATIILYIIRRICWQCSNLLYRKISKKIMVELNHDITNQTLKLKSKTFSDNNTGTFVQRMIYEPDAVLSSFIDVIDMITNIMTSLVTVIYISTLNIFIGITIFAVIILATVVEYIRVKRLRKNQRQVNKTIDKVNSICTEIVRSEKDVKALGLEEKLNQIQSDSFSAYKNATYKKDVTHYFLNNIKQTILEFGGIGCLILGIILLEKGAIVLGTYMLIYSNHDELYGLIWNLGNILDFITRAKISSQRMFELFDDNVFESEKFGNLHINEVKGNIEFKRVGFSYVEYDTPNFEKLTKKERKEYKKNPPKLKIKSANKVLDNLSFKIEPNTTVAFVGKSGSGKSTILNLMAKMYEVDKGQVLIDGINIKDLDKDTLRTNISLVNQFPYIFDMTIKENLLLAKKDATDEEILDALARASLSEFIASLPNGVDTKVGESGIKLSGGQKQRLAIARALLRNSPIIIFDESTSSLDNFAQEDIKHSIDQLKGHGTIVIVAHRLSTIRNADKIFFLDNGKIEDIGTFDELFENNIKFKNMFYAENLE